MVVLLAMICLTTSCSNDDDKEDTPKEENEDNGGGKESKEAETLLGRWLVMETRGASQTVWTQSSTVLTSAFQFDADGTYAVYLGGEKLGTSSYKVDGKKIVITADDNTQEFLEILEISQDGSAMELLRYKKDGITPDTYYRISRCPSNAAEAKKMLMTQWKLEVPEDEYLYTPYDAEYADFSKEGKEDYIYHYKKYLPSDDPYYQYRDKYVCWSYFVCDVVITPDKTDPTTCAVSYVNHDGKSGSFNIIRLCSQSFLMGESIKYTRVEKPFKYEVISTK